MEENRLVSVRVCPLQTPESGSEEASETYMKGVLSFTDEELVSSDMIHNVTLFRTRVDDVETSLQVLKTLQKTCF